jgi:hypothetical protein
LQTAARKLEKLGRLFHRKHTKLPSIETVWSIFQASKLQFTNLVL